MFSDLDETIKQVLIKEGQLDPAEIEISFEIPNREWSAGIAKPTINCYLFDIRENRELRQGGMQTDRNGAAPARRRPPLRLDLTYLITAWTRAVEDEHRLLWHALRTLMRFSALPPALLQGELEGHALPVHTRLAQEGVLKSPGEFWTALENQLKPSLNFVCTLAVEHDRVPAGPPVLTFTTRLRTLELEAAGAGETRLGGVVRDPAGQPLADVTIAVEGHGAPATTGPDGRFILRVPAPGPYILVARAGAKITRQAVSVPAPDYSLTLAADEPPARPRARRGGRGGDEATP
jgi:hypothetical protein